MKKDFDTTLKDFDGNDVKDRDEVVTMKTLAYACIQASDQKECSGEEKGRKFELSIKIHKGGVVDLKSEEITLLKDLAGRSLTTLGYGRFVEFLDTDMKGKAK